MTTPIRYKPAPAVGRVHRHRRQFAGTLLVVAALAASVSLAQAAGETTATKEAIAPEAASPAQQVDQGPVIAQKHMVVAANPHASRAGLDMLRAGGSAVDAAIAAQMVLTLVEPQSSGIGGGAFLLHFNGAANAIDAYDGRETAPAAASEDLFLKDDGSPMGFWEAVVGGRSVGAPGVLRMLELAHQQHGRLPWKDLFQPAIELARAGFKVSPRLHGLVDRDKYLKTFPETAAYFHAADGTAKPVGTLLRNPALAETLTAIAEGGAEAFYEGNIAADIVAAIQQAAPNPGLLSLEDLAGYKAVRRDPVCLPYQTWNVCGMPPPTSGGVTLLQTLGVLDHYSLKSLPPFSSAALHLIAEASRLAFADRGRYLADPDHVRVPAARLLDPGYLLKRAVLLSRHRSIGEAQPGLPDKRASMPLQTAPPSTSHLAVVDGDGNAVSMTSSIENAFGSRIMVRGFLLNNQLTDFSFRPTVDGRPVANRVQAGKRPRSSMAPTLVLGSDDKLVLAVGSPGGSRIIGYVLKTVIGVLDWDLDIQSAIASPHVVNRNGATDLEADRGLETLAETLQALGHETNLRDMTSGLHGIHVTPRGLEGGADPRREGVALGD